MNFIMSARLHVPFRRRARAAQSVGEIALPASLTWVDFSADQQRRMMELLGAWAERETLDQLGIGTIRDAFSDFFFPGTSTIQTRARYMLFVPWMYRDLEVQRISSGQIQDRVREYEEHVVVSLQRNCPDEPGIIGAQAGRSVLQMPSSIYWTGLESWGIRRFEGLRRAYHQKLDGFYERLKHRRGLDSEVQQETAAQHNWHPKLPVSPEEWPAAKTLALQHAEAIFLRDRTMEEHPDALLARLIDLRVADGDTPRLWAVPETQRLSSELREEMDRAQSFAELMQGANLVYALVLAEMDECAEAPEGYREQLLDWADLNVPRLSAHAQHADPGQWLAVQQRRPSRSALSFEGRWRAHLLGLADLHDLAGDHEAKQMIAEREVRVKGRRARVHGGRRLERWTGLGQVSTLDFRWVTVRTMIADIVQGLELENHA